MADAPVEVTLLDQMIAKMATDWLNAPAAEKESARTYASQMVSGNTTAVLEAMESTELRERYWHLYACHNPHIGLPMSWRAPLDKSVHARRLRHVRKNEMLRIEKIMRERQEPLKQGEKYESLFGKPSTAAPTPTVAPVLVAA